MVDKRLPDKIIFVEPRFLLGPVYEHVSMSSLHRRKVAFVTEANIFFLLHDLSDESRDSQCAVLPLQIVFLHDCFPKKQLYDKKRSNKWKLLKMLKKK